MGWAIGDGRTYESHETEDAAEADALYTVLEQEIVPTFYERNHDGIPPRWVARMRESMARLTPRFSANRTVREYVEQYYLPAAAAYQSRAAENGARGAQIVNWRRTLEQWWNSVHFGGLEVKTSDLHHEFCVQVYLGELPAEVVQVELYADPCDGEAPLRHVMTRTCSLTGAINGYEYTARVPAERPAEHFTPRLIPFHPDAATPLETSQILWRR